MSRKFLKEQAQDELMAAMQAAFDAVEDEEILKEMDKQFARVEKLFGFEPSSFNRGC